jgi:hypothetical protein
LFGNFSAGYYVGLFTGIIAGAVVMFIIMMVIMVTREINKNDSSKHNYLIFFKIREIETGKCHMDVATVYGAGSPNEAFEMLTDYVMKRLSEDANAAVTYVCQSYEVHKMRIKDCNQEKIILMD